MTFAFGFLIGFAVGIGLTLWNDRQNACKEGGFHYWVDDIDIDYASDKGRYCSKCLVDEEENWMGRSDGKKKVV